MGSPVKGSRIRKMREIANLQKEVEIFQQEFEEHQRARKRLSRKARQFANKVKRVYPDMRVDGQECLTLHEAVEELASAIYLPTSSSKKDDPIVSTSSSLELLQFLLRRLVDVPWLQPDGAVDTDVDL